MRTLRLLLVAVLIAAGSLLIGNSGMGAASTQPPMLRSKDESPDLHGYPDVVTLKGIATWYGTGVYCRRHPCVTMYAAAGPLLRQFIHVKWRMKPFAIQIKSVLTGKTVTAYVVDWCSCKGHKNVDDDRIVDLAPAVWKALGVRLGRGIMKVEITVVNPQFGGH